uniref:Poly [ADP-ribose] polymerase n=1 Tax=Strigamia maritima TaxID=126957 RepID=T1IQQ9_STRMM
MSDDLPYRAEYAKSGRASCKSCKAPIQKGSLRLAVMIQQPNWFHFDCFFGRSRPKTVGDIAHFDQLRWEDQEKIKKAVEATGTALVKSQLSSKKESADFSTEYAKSSRSICRGCSEKITKNLVRISKKDFEGEAARFGPADLWYHVDCFVSNREDLQFFGAADVITGFKSLKPEDQADLKKKLPIMKSAIKRLAESNKDGPTSKKAKAEENAEEMQLKKQSKLIFDFRDKLETQLKKKDLQELLDYNHRTVPTGESRMLDSLADAMTFGNPKPCKECQGGKLVYQTEGYKCHGNMTEWTKCTFVTKNPEREPFTVPGEMKEKFDFLKKYKYVKRERIFSSKNVPSTPSTSTSSSKPPEADLPLSNMRFVTVGKLSKGKPALVKAIESLGGKVVTKIDKTVAAVISTKAEVDKMSKKIEEAEDADVHVISEDYIDSVQNGGAVLLIIEKSICDWGSDPHSRVQEPGDVKSKKSGAKEKESRFTKSMPSTLKMTVKGGAAVDPASELQDVAHVLEVNGEIYNAILGLVDIARGTNSFYKLQILEGDKKNKYWLFRSWGRVGTTIGGQKVEDMSDQEDAIESFQALYLEKSGNQWINRKNFVKQPNRFYPLDIDYGQDDEKIKRLKEDFKNSKSKLEKEIQNLIRMIFDVESMQKALVEFEIDLKKMPLGKLSRKQIQNAFSILTELLTLIETKASAAKFLDASNRFYTLIPHDFGIKKPTALDNEEVIKQKIEMLNNLLEIEVAYSLLQGENDSSKDPIDAHYEKLKTEIEVLDRKSEEFDLIQKYVKNTHASTHNQYGLEIIDVFKVVRQGEAKRFKPFKKLHNRKLLWHGSRVTNYAGILSQGLRIAPPEAPSTGYMFGKGVYFADMVSKSANYCCTNKSNPIGLMLLCEVALGNMHELKNADFVTKLPSGKHSTKGIGVTEPDPTVKHVDSDGVEIPLGQGVKSSVPNTSLLYNEYIVYDVSQINVKYLLKMNFKWRY